MTVKNIRRGMQVLDPSLEEVLPELALEVEQKRILKMARARGWPGAEVAMYHEMPLRRWVWRASYDYAGELLHDGMNRWADEVLGDS